MADKIQFRRDTSTNWTSANPVLSEGELGLETDTLAYKIGDGSTAWNSLSYREFSGSSSGLYLTATTEPSTPTGQVVLYSKSVGGRLMPKFKEPSGLESPLQPFFGQNKIAIWSPPGNATTVPGVFGYTAYTAVGTATARNVATTNVTTRMRRLGYVSASTGGSLASLRVPAAQITTGDGNGVGGFFKAVRFAISDAATVSGARMFIGVSSTTGAPTNVEPSTLTNCIGVGHGAADTNLKIFYGGSAAQTPIDLGSNFPITAGSVESYELILFSPPNENSVIKYRVSRLGTNHVAEGTLSGTPGTTTPIYTTLLSYFWGYRTNNATALAVGLDLISDYIETDY